MLRSCESDCLAVSPPTPDRSDLYGLPLSGASVINATQLVNIPQCDYKHEFANALLHGYIPTSLCKTVLFAFLQPQLLGICILQKDEKTQKELLPTKHSSMCLRRASREPSVSWQSVVIQSHVRPKRHRTCCNDNSGSICPHSNASCKIFHC